MKTILLAVLLSMSTVAIADTSACNPALAELEAKHEKLKRMYLKAKDDLEMETLELNLMSEAYYELVEKNKKAKNN